MEWCTHSSRIGVVYDNQILCRQYLDFFGIDGSDAGGGVGTTTAIIFGMVSTEQFSIFHRLMFQSVLNWYLNPIARDLILIHLI